MTISKQKTILQSNTIPQVALDFMNNTHFEEIDLVKELGELIEQYQHGNSHGEEQVLEITQKMQAWLEHTEAHFKRENELMQETGFPAYGIHAEEHEITLNRLKAATQAWQQDHDIEVLADYVFTLWPAWFDNHVNTMDMMTAKFAVMNGYIEGSINQ